jgi:opacity protein-like surface antigen
VPIPAPVPETFAWYVRLDVGVGTTGGDASQNGFDYGNSAGYWADAPRRMSWFDSSSDAFFQGGIGFGRYLSPRFRMDATLDYKTADDYSRTGVFSYDLYNGPAPGGVVTADDVRVNGTESVEVADGVMLINGYFDLVPRGRFTPYIGLGAGFAARFIERSHTSTETIVSGGVDGASQIWTGDGKDTQFAPAVSATAGFTWAISQGTMLDVNYRYTYIGSVDTSMTIVASDASVQRSKITINESHQHAIRAGLRWNIW